MTRETLVDQIYNKKSCLCIGLDADIKKIPSFLIDHYEDPVFEFNRQIIDYTRDLCVSYKMNIAFYESRGVNGWNSLAKTLEYIPDDVFTIADAKRGDIGNTSKMYARTFFEQFDFDSITVAPYMGSDSVEPFLEFKGKWVVLLALTSNPGSEDFQYFTNDKGESLYQKVIRESQNWAGPDHMMYVVGATHPEKLKEIRESIPDHFLLIPGVGAQGGTVAEVMSAAYISNECGLLINSSRGIIYAGDGKDFAEQSRAAALELQRDMAEYF